MARALALITPDDTITSDESAESIELSGQLPHCAHLTVVTNGLITASRLADLVGVTIVTLPGQLDRPSRSIIPSTLLQRWPGYSDHAFFGATAYTRDGGLMERSTTWPDTKTLLNRHSREATAAITADAVNQFGPYTLASANDITSLHIIGDHRSAASGPSD